MAGVNPDKRILSHSTWDCKCHARCAAIPPKDPRTRLARVLRISQPAVSYAVTRREQPAKNGNFSITGSRINEYASPLSACSWPATAFRQIRRFDHSGFRIGSDSVGSGRPGNRLSERNSHGPSQASRGRYRWPLPGYGSSLRAAASEPRTRLIDGTSDNCKWSASSQASPCKSLSHPSFQCTPKPHD